jgi:hypothetical protein
MRGIVLKMEEAEGLRCGGRGVVKVGCWSFCRNKLVEEGGLGGAPAT